MSGHYILLPQGVKLQPGDEIWKERWDGSRWEPADKWLTTNSGYPFRRLVQGEPDLSVQLEEAQKSIAMLNDRLSERTTELLGRHADDIRERQYADWEMRAQLTEAWSLIRHAQLYCQPRDINVGWQSMAGKWLAANEAHRPEIRIKPEGGK